MKKLIIIASLLLSNSLFAEVSKRVANNGNLVMEDVPEIPQRIADDLNQYQNIRSAPFQGWSKDGKSLYVTTRFGDVSQIHQVSQPMGARKQMTFFKEPIGGISRNPDSDLLAYTMDAGGSEYAQIFLLDHKTGQSTMVTDGKSRNGGISWSGDGQYMAYQSTKRNGRSNDVWMMQAGKPDTAKIILEAEDGASWGAADWSKDNRSVLIQQYVSISDARIHVLDRQSGKIRMLAGSKTDNSFNSGLSFDNKGAGFFYVTNQSGEFRQLAYQDLNSDKPEFITKNINWDVSGFAINKDKTRAVFTVNQDGMDALYLLDVKTRKYKKVTGMPIGRVSGMEFNPVSAKLGLTLNTPQSPSDTFVLDLGKNPLSHGKLTRWTDSEVGGLDTSKFSIPELIRYESFDGRQIPAFVYKPKTTGKHPVIIAIHGGPEGQFRPSFRSDYQLWVDKLDAIVIAPNVRGSAGYGKSYLQLDNGFKREDSVKDIGALLDWVGTQKDMDAKRVAVYGGSYGGYMVLASSVHYSDKLAAAVDVVGISNFVTFLENTKAYRRDLRRVEYGDERDPAMRKHLQAISPNNHVDKINIPMFVVQGENDPRVPVTESDQVVKSLREAGKKVWYMNALNEGHGYRKKENRDIYQQAVVLFFEKNL
ncbi:MAG: S9 family peptidase [Gammaproteobacteria bacterium]|nr:S9 family peptidase [Gammaproteobacteria bacterium]